MAWTSHFQDFWTYQKLWKHSYQTYLYLLLADSLPLAGISAVFLLSGPLIYGYESRPQRICHAPPRVSGVAYTVYGEGELIVDSAEL